MNNSIFQELTEPEIEFLYCLYKHPFYSSIELCVETGLSSQYRMERLKDNGYIVFRNDELALTFKGVAALEDYEKYLANKKATKTIERFRFWTPILINSAFSLIAIIISIVALLKP